VSNTARTIKAFAEEDFEAPAEFRICDINGEDTWTVSVNVSVVTLRT
jgi:hypothetical protein